MEHRLLALVRRAGDTRPDAELLARSRHDPAAFAELVARHGPLVWGVCRHLLGEADAEDAFQATFLALLRSAVRDGAALAAWLHGVAVRVALAARREAGRRRAREQAVAAPEPTPPREPDDWADTMAAVHREVAALPEADRSAFILCVLEGLTQAEAAARLGRTPGAVAGQVARAKKRLVARLTGRGIVPVLAALGTASVAGAVPPGLVKLTSGLPDAVVPPAVVRLVKGAMGMNASSPKVILAAATVVAGLAAGALAAAAGLPEATMPAPPPADVKLPVPADGPPAKVPAPFELAERPRDEKPAVTGPRTDPPTPDVRTLRGHSGAVYFAAFSPNGQTLVTAAKGLTETPRADEVIIWEVTAQRARHRIQFKDPVTIWSLTLSADGKTVAVGTSAGIELRDAETGQTERMLKGPWALSTGPFCLAFAPDGKALAAGGSARDNIVRLWDVRTGELTGTLKGHEDAVVGLHFSPDGKTLASTGGQYDTTVRYWEVATGQLRRTVRRAQEVSKDGTEAVDGDWQTWPAAFSPDGTILARGRGAEVKFWDARTGAVKDRVIEGSHPANRIIQSLAFSPDGKLVAGGRSSGEVDVWGTRPADGKNDWRIGDRERTLDKEHGHPVMALAFSPSGELLASGDQDGRVRVWKMTKK